jgi:hypothetical protein
VSSCSLHAINFHFIRQVEQVIWFPTSAFVDVDARRITNSCLRWCRAVASVKQSSDRQEPKWKGMNGRVGNWTPTQEVGWLKASNTSTPQKKKPVYSLLKWKFLIKKYSVYLYCQSSHLKCWNQFVCVCVWGGDPLKQKNKNNLRSDGRVV